MTFFSTASQTQQSLLMAAILCVLIFSLFSATASFGNKKRKAFAAVDVGLFLLLFVGLVALVTAFSQLHENGSTDISLPLPMWAMWLVTCASFIFLATETVVRYLRRGRYLSRDCVKQAMDMFPCAVCYFAPSGEVKLCNLQMHRLFHSLAQKELQNLDDLTRALDGCDEKTGIIRLSDVRQTYLFPNGKVWRYSQNKVTANSKIYTEALFVDVTELYEKNLELHRQTSQLQKISVEIKRLSDNVQTLAEERENLVAKSKLHDLMGSGLLAIRQILRQKTTSRENAAAVMQFRRAVGILREENVRPQYDVVEFIRDAKVSGIHVEISGCFPEEKEVLRFVLPVLREACVNAARHADATVLFVDVKARENAVVFQITNNGTPPKSEIVPRGGLADFKKRTEEAGGTMEIASKPAFCITLTLPLKNKSREANR